MKDGVRGENVEVGMFYARSRTLTEVVISGSFCGMEGICDDLLPCRYVRWLHQTMQIGKEHTKILMATRGTAKMAEAYNTFLSRMNIA